MITLAIILLTVATLVTVALAFCEIVTRWKQQRDVPALSPGRAVPIWLPARVAGILCILFIAACVWMGMPSRSGAQSMGTSSSSLTQASGLVSPRTWTIFAGLQVSNTQVFSNGNFAASSGLTNLLGTNDPNSQNWLTNVQPYWVCPTFLPPSGSKSVGLTLIINNTNNFGHSSNMVVTVYAAYDGLGGNSSSVSTRYGQLFGTAPLLTWTVTYTTNLIITTNIPASGLGGWEPATALGFTLQDSSTATASGPVSNKWCSLYCTITP